jgi:long-chain acyl-CoA synthetase
VNEKLAAFETIKKFTLLEEPLTVDNGLLTPTMKVRRKKVYERFGDAFTALYAA